MFYILLLILNIPVYLFLAWVVFDTPGKAADTLFDSLVELLKTMAFGVHGDTFNLFPLFSFLVGCLVVTLGEIYLLETYVFDMQGQGVFQGF